MNLIDLKNSAATVAYQLRKSFPEGESPVSHYVCENQVVIISTKHLYIFYCETFTDYKMDVLSNVIVTDKDLEKSKCNILLQGRQFHVKFSSQKEMNYLLKYIDKYK
jgi:hypothetical protein